MKGPLGASIKPTPRLEKFMLNYVIFLKIQGEKWLLKKCWKQPLPPWTLDGTPQDLSSGKSSSLRKSSSSHWNTDNSREKLLKNGQRLTETYFLMQHWVGFILKIPKKVTTRNNTRVLKNERPRPPLPSIPNTTRIHRQNLSLPTLHQSDQMQLPRARSSCQSRYAICQTQKIGGRSVSMQFGNYQGVNEKRQFRQQGPTKSDLNLRRERKKRSWETKKDVLVDVLFCGIWEDWKKDHFRSPSSKDDGKWESFPL